MRGSLSIKEKQNNDNSVYVNNATHSTPLATGVQLFSLEMLRVLPEVHGTICWPPTSYWHPTIRCNLLDSGAAVRCSRPSLTSLAYFCTNRSTFGITGLLGACFTVTPAPSCYVPFCTLFRSSPY